MGTIVKLFFNTAVRFGYPFAPALSRGLGVPLTSINSILATNEVMGAFGLLSGPLSDRAGRKRMMLAGTAMLAGGMLAGSLLTGYWGVLMALACQHAQAQRPAHYYPSRPTFSPYLLYNQVNLTGIPNYYTFVQPATQYRDFLQRKQATTSHRTRSRS